MNESHAIIPTLHRVTLVEDDERLAAAIKEYLQTQGFDVRVATRGDVAVDVITSEPPDLVILDLMLPGLDGLEVCRRIRPHFIGPILMLTARDEDVEQVVGLELGADDYVTKPVEPRVLLARMRALLRHAERAGAQRVEEKRGLLTFGRFSINQATRSVVFDGETVQFTDIEFELLWLLASHAGEIVSRDFVFKQLTGNAYDGLDRAVDIRISRIRKGLSDDPANPTKIKTVRGKGYLFVESAWE